MCEEQSDRLSPTEENTSGDEHSTEQDLNEGFAGDLISKIRNLGETSFPPSSNGLQAFLDDELDISGAEVPERE